MSLDTDQLARVARGAWVEYIRENATNPPAKWLEEFDDLSPFWQNLNRHIANRLTKAILEESSGTQDQGRTPEDLTA